MFTILLAGEDTTANTLSWTAWLLGSCADVQARIAEAVLREPIRLKPVAPFLPLEPLADTEISEVGVPAETRLLLMTRSVTRDAAGRSEELYPERWLTESEETAAPKSLAFGAGPRFCPGRTLAFLESKAALATLCRDFEIELDDSGGEVREAFKLAMVPVGLRVRLRERGPVVREAGRR